MKTIRFYLSIGLVGCRVTGSLTVDEDCTEEEIDEMIRDAVMDRIEWGQEAS